MVAFYEALGSDVVVTPHLVSVHVGDQMINFHRAATWRREGFTLRALAATPPCGDLCFVWDGTVAELRVTLDAAGCRDRRGPGGATRCARASTRRACTCATRTATCSSS